MNYGDGTVVEIEDEIEVNEEDFEPERGKVIKIGKKKIQIEWLNPNIKSFKEWVDPAQCELIARAG